MTQKTVGKPINRIEGKEKVTGTAQYAADYRPDDLLHGYVVSSPVTKGKIRSINTRPALEIDGVVEVITHENRPKVASLDLKYTDMDAPQGTVFKPLYDNEILYNGQPIALVIAEDFETARYASSLIIFDIEEESFETCLDNHKDRARDSKKGIASLMKPGPPKPTGNFEKAYAEAPYKTDALYRHGAEHHNPIELFATTTVYEGDGKLTIYDKTQGTVNNQFFIANIFGLKYKDVRVVAPYVGGAFGSGLRPQYQLYLSAMAALALKRNVRVVLDRSQMFTFGHRPQTHQHLRFAAGLDGKITAMQHATVGETSRFEDYTETVSNWSHRIYPADNTLLTYQLVPLDVYTPIDMRSPGGSTAFATIECTIDELAYKLGMDPMEFRLLNYAEVDPSNGKPFTSKALRECYLEGAERFGWKNRNPEPKSMTRGNKWVGYGLAAGMWDANQFPARMEARINADGHLEIENAVTDIGTGTFTVITQIAADEIGLTVDKVSFLYGDSKRPFSMIQGGSTMTASTGAAVVVSVRALKEKILKAVKKMDVPAMKDVSLDAVDFKDGSIYLKGQPHISVSFKEIIAARKGKVIKTTNMATPQMLKLRKYSRAAHGVSFVEVEVDKELREITVTRALTAIAAGTIINPKTARSQIEGSMVWGISKALQEESLLDEHLGKFMNHNLAEYYIPVHADVNELDVIFVDERDDIINELGIKGVGEIGLVSMPAAVANAIYHATGKRVNKLPIHLEDLL